MIFLDESGDDGVNKKSNTNFFTLCIVFEGDIDFFKSEYFRIKKEIKINKKDYKWHTLNKTQKENLINILKTKVSYYKVYCVYARKSKLEAGYSNLYYKISLDIFSQSIRLKESVRYTGQHMSKMLAKVKSKIRNKKLSFKQASGDELYGVAIADLWAGYINYSIKNNLEIPVGRNINIIEYTDKVKTK